MLNCCTVLRGLAAVLLCFPLVVFATEDVLDLADLEERNWIKVSSPYFHIVSDQKEADVKYLARELEKFRVVSQVVTGVRLSDNDRPVKVIAMRDRSTFKLLLGSLDNYKKFQGVFFADDSGNYAIVKMTGSNKRGSIDAQTSKSVLFHEYVHYVTSLRSGRPLPIWFREGIAEYLSTVRFDRKKDRLAYVGNIVGYHIDNIRHMKWMPVEELLKTTSLDWNASRKTYRVYSQGWLLTHYCFRDDKRKKQLLEYLSLQLNGEPIDDAFSKAFNMTYAEMDNELRKHFNKQRFEYGALKIAKSQLKSDLTVRKIDASEMLFEVGDVLLNVINNFAHAKQLFSRSVELDKNNADSIAGLANVAMIKGPLDEAVTLIDQAEKVDPDNIWVNTIKGHVYRAKAFKFEDRASKEFFVFANGAARAYGKAVNGELVNIEALVEFSYFYVSLGKYEKALQIAEIAESYSPSNYLVRTAMIRACYANGKFDRANEIIEWVKSDPHWSPKKEKRFNDWLQRVKNDFSIDDV